MNWIERLERLQRRYLLVRNRDNVRAHRKRLRLVGAKRIDLALSPSQFSALLAQMRTGETYSATIGRLLEQLATPPADSSSPTN